MAHPLIPRAAQALVEQALRRSPVVAVVGPRQCGKTTLARQLVAPDSPNYFDLEDPVSLARLDQRLTAVRRRARRPGAAPVPGHARPLPARSSTSPSWRRP